MNCVSSSVLVVMALASTVLGGGQAGKWWQGAPECAHSCLSAEWDGAAKTTDGGWPHQSEYCDADKGKKVGDCINDACGKTTTAYPSYSSLSASLCSKHASCTEAGSTGVHSLTYPGGPVTWAAPGGWKKSNFNNGGGDKDNDHKAPWNKDGNNGASWHGNHGAKNASQASPKYWSDWASAYSGSKTWTGGVVTVTGCAFEGSPWFVGPDCGWNGLGGFNGWVGWGSGWSWGPTETKTVTVTTTDEKGQQTTETGKATVAVAISGSLTTSSIIGAVQAKETSGSPTSPNAAPRLSGPGPEGSIVTILMGLGLGAVIAIAGLL
ncbi:hypothetical protein GGS20DRAFT_322568 [Poronia punctata]|nr:hypothetical protein GGS20DRAFT_322568 [Poronia punctata]